MDLTPRSLWVVFVLGFCTRDVSSVFVLSDDPERSELYTGADSEDELKGSVESLYGKLESYIDTLTKLPLSGEDFSTDNNDVDRNLEDNEEDELKKRFESGTFFGIRGKKAPSYGFFGARGKKMASMGFVGARGRKSMPEVEGLLDKKVEPRAPNNRFFGARGKKANHMKFFGSRGKKAPSMEFFGARGKKAPGMGFVGSRGKKNYADDENREDYNTEMMGSFYDTLKQLADEKE